MTTRPIGADATRPAPGWAAIGLGANLGDPARALAEAIAAIDRLPATRVTARSRRYASAPVDASGPDFVNQVVRVDTTLDPQALLAALHAIEADAGRERPWPNAPRTLDLDLLLWGEAGRASARIVRDDLVLPHPRMHERLFVLMPLVEIWPDCEIPGVGPARRALAAVSARGAQACRPLPA